MIFTDPEPLTKRFKVRFALFPKRLHYKNENGRRIFGWIWLESYVKHQIYSEYQTTITNKYKMGWHTEEVMPVQYSKKFYQQLKQKE
jgi:hypothetical protein